MSGHPSLEQGVSPSDRVCGNGQCYAQFDSKADRVRPMGTNSDQPFWRAIAVLGLFSHVHKNTPFVLSPAAVDAIEQSLIARQNNSHLSQTHLLLKCGKNRHFFGYYNTMYIAYIKAILIQITNIYLIFTITQLRNIYKKQF